MRKLMLFTLAIIPLMSIAQNPLLIPDTLSGRAINLTLQNGQVPFYGGINTQTIGYNQAILGPTLMLNKGDSVTINVSNILAEPTTLHWHGLHVSSDNDGGPHTVIDTGKTWSPSFGVLDNAATYWYHPHLHEHTEEQVTKGGAGFIIVRDNDEKKIILPRTYGIDDFPIAVQSRGFDGSGQFLINTALDTAILCNGTVNAFLDLPAQVVRLRLLNGATERVLNLGFQGNLGFHQIATDGGLLDAPVPLTRLRLVPGERAEILVDLSTHLGSTINLMSFSSELPRGTYGAANPSVMPVGSIPGYTMNPLNGSDFKVLQLQVISSTPNPVTSIPATLIVNAPWSTLNVDTTRNITFQPAQMGPTGMVNGPFVLNGRGFDMGFINQKIPLNNTEIWELTNSTAIAHPFHIHDVQFYILEINGAAPPTNMLGKKDVVLVPPMGGTVRFITKFEDFANSNTPYMYHCHMLSHEDEGMMGQFIVFDNTTSVDAPNVTLVSLFPNPTSGKITLKGLDQSTIKLFNAQGKLLRMRLATNAEEEINLNDYPDGVYFLHVSTAKARWSYKVIKIAK